MPENTDNTFEAMAKRFAKPEGLKTGTFVSKLTKAEQAEVEAFGAWLKGQMTDGSVASYRTYLAGCLVAFKAGKSRKDLTASQRSAMNKYAEFLESR